MRSYTVLPLAMPRATTAPVQFEGHTIPEGTMVFLNAWACNRGEISFFFFFFFFFSLSSSSSSFKRMFNFQKDLSFIITGELTSVSFAPQTPTPSTDHGNSTRNGGLVTRTSTPISLRSDTEHACAWHRIWRPASCTRFSCTSLRISRSGQPLRIPMPPLIRSRGSRIPRR